MSSSAAAPKQVERPDALASSVVSLPEWRTALFSALLVFAVFLSYSAVIHNGFLNYDDDSYITKNVHVRAGLTWSTVKWAFTTYDEANWAPLSWLSHALDCQLFGLNPAGHHAVSVVLHAMNAVLLFLLVQRLTGLRWRSLMVAALFALHPLAVESVAWAAERKNVLSMLFFLLALHAYVWYARQPALGRYAAVAGLFAVGLLSKSQVITFPFLAWLLDYWPLGRIPAEATPAQESNAAGFWKKWRVLEKLPLLLLSGASAVITMRAEKAGGAVESYSRYGLTLRVETALVAYARYLGKLLWPAKLVALYPRPTQLYPLWEVGAAALLLLFLTVWVLRARPRYLAVGWLWFLGSLVPMIGLVQVGPQAMADRFAYIPCIGVFLALTWLVADWAGARGISLRWLGATALCSLVALGILNYRQVGYWRDIPTFWMRTIALTEGNYVAQNNLGSYLFTQGRADEAASHYRAALAIRPENLVANMNLAAYEESRGNFVSAMEKYEAALRQTADVDLRASAYASMGFDYRAMGQPEKAKRCFETAVSLAPYRARAMIGLGLLAEERGDLPDALRQYSRGATVQRADVTLFLLARAQRLAGHLEEANAVAARIENLAQAQAAAESFLSKK